MSEKTSILSVGALRGVARVAFTCVLLCAGCQAQAAGLAALTVLVADDVPAHAEFAQLLRSGAGPGAAAADDDRGVTAGVRTRSVRPSSGTATESSISVAVAVGVAAARAALDRPGTEPLLLAMLGRLDYESLRASPGLRRADRRVAVLLRDPAMADQIALIDAVLPGKRRLGVVATAESGPLVRELQRAADGWTLQVQYAPDAKSLAAALRLVVPVSDALVVLPDLIGDDQAATLAVLHAGAGAGVPVFGSSDGLVRSGGLAAVVSTPAQLAHQARAMAQKLTAQGAGSSSAAAGAVLVEAATPATVRLNATVARALGLRLPDERELAERVGAAR